MKRSSIVVGIVAFILAACATAYGAQRVYLGERTVSFKVDHDEITVKGNDVFERVQFEVRRAGVEMIDMKVFFENGTSEDVALKSFIEAGGWSREIDLPGEKRAIRRVTFTYKSGPHAHQKAVVKLYGIR